MRDAIVKDLMRDAVVKNDLTVDDDEDYLDTTMKSALKDYVKNNEKKEHDLEAEAEELEKKAKRDL